METVRALGGSGGLSNWTYNLCNPYSNSSYPGVLTYLLSPLTPNPPPLGEAGKSRTGRRNKSPKASTRKTAALWFSN